MSETSDDVERIEHPAGKTLLDHDHDLVVDERVVYPDLGGERIIEECSDPRCEFRRADWIDAQQSDLDAWRDI